MEERYQSGQVIPSTNWTLGESLGETSCGTAREISYERDGYTHKAAVRIIRIPRSDEEIEVLRTENRTDDEIKRMFVEKAQHAENVLEQLRGKRHVVHYEDCIWLSHEDNIGFDLIIRTELLTPLRERVAKGGFDKKEAARLGYDICRALEECQDERTIHPEVKPDNIFVTERGEYKLDVFNVAHTLWGDAAGHRDDAEAYMAPEAYLRQSYHSSGNTYALGLLLYALLQKSGANRDNANAAFSLQERNAQFQRDRLSGKPLPDLETDPDLNDIILTACAYKPKKRYPSPAKMREDFQYYLADAPIFWWKPLFWKLSRLELLERQNQYYASLHSTPSDSTPSGGASASDGQSDSGRKPDVLMDTPPDDASPNRMEPPFKPLPPPSLKRLKRVAAVLLLTLCLALVSVTLYLKLSHARVDSVTIEPEEISLTAGENGLLSAALTPSDARTEIHWSSENEETAIVREDGTVIAVNPGVTAIQAAAGGKTASCQITVLPMWSEWTDTLPEEVQPDSYDIEEKTQYSSRTLQTQESAYPSMEGWTLAGQSESYGDYGAWSDWTTSAAQSSDTTQVETKTQYRSRTRQTRESAYPSIEGWTRIDSSSTYGDYGAWSDWTTSAVQSSDTTQVETKTQYRSRTRQTTTSASSSLDGWVRVSSSSSYGDYGAWSDWTTSPIQSGDTTKVETKTQYRYRDKQTKTDASASLSGWTRIGGPNYGEWGETKTASSRPSESDTLQVTGSKQTSWGYYHYCNKYENGGNGWNVDSVAWGGISSIYHKMSSSFALPAFSMPDKGGQQPYGGKGTGASPCPYNFYVWFRDSSQDAYEYYYQTRSVSYTFEKWGDWSSWSDSSVDASGSREVSTRVLYRSSVRQQNTMYTFEKWGDWSAWSDSPVSASGGVETDSRTLYRSRSRNVNTTYTFEKWGDWSSWSDSPVSKTSERDVQTRTAYRARSRSVNTTYTFEKWDDWSSWSDSEILASSARETQTLTLYRSRVRPKTITYTHEQWSPWSEYGDNSIPESDGVNVRTKTLYRYRPKS